MRNLFRRFGCPRPDTTPVDSLTTTPSFHAVGTGSNGANPTPAYPTNAAGDLYVLEFFVAGGTATTPTGWTLQSSVTQAANTLYMYTRDTRASGSDSGTVSLTSSGSNGQAQIASYSNVATSSFVENIATATSTNSTVSMPTVGPVGGNHRLAVCGVFSNAGLNGMAPATGESGGDWVESAAEHTSGIGFGIQLQHATLDSGGTISGGSQTVTGSSSACLVGFALVGV